MNKKGTLKQFLILFLIMVSFMLLYYFFIFRSAGILKFEVSCPENSIPERILLEYSEHTIMGGEKIIDKNFFDGKCVNGFYGGCRELPKEGMNITNLTGCFTCTKGSLKGENINYFYCKDIEYYKENINSNGDIGKATKLTISLIIDPKDKTDTGYKIIEYTCKN